MKEDQKGQDSSAGLASPTTPDLAIIPGVDQTTQVAKAPSPTVITPDSSVNKPPDIKKRGGLAGKLLSLVLGGAVVASQAPDAMAAPLSPATTSAPEASTLFIPQPRPEPSVQDPREQTTPISLETKTAEPLTTTSGPVSLSTTPAPFPTLPPSEVSTPQPIQPELTPTIGVKEHLPVPTVPIPGRVVNATPSVLPLDAALPTPAKDTPLPSKPAEIPITPNQPTIAEGPALQPHSSSTPAANEVTGLPTPDKSKTEQPPQLTSVEALRKEVKQEDLEKFVETLKKIFNFDHNLDLFNKITNTFNLPPNEQQAYFKVEVPNPANPDNKKYEFYLNNEDLSPVLEMRITLQNGQLRIVTEGAIDSEGSIISLPKSISSYTNRQLQDAMSKALKDDTISWTPSQNLLTGGIIGGTVTDDGTEHIDISVSQTGIFNAVIIPETDTSTPTK